MKRVAAALLLALPSAALAEEPAPARVALAREELGAAPRATPARTPAPRMRLDYRRGPGAEGCPGQREFAAYVAANGVGSMLDAQAPAHLVVTAARAPKGYLGTAELLDPGGTRVWDVAAIPGSHCSAVMDAVALGIAIKIGTPVGEPSTHESESPPVKPIERPAAAPVPQAAPAPAPVPPPRTPGVWEGQAGAARVVLFAVAGVSAGVGAGFAVAARITGDRAEQALAAVQQMAGQYGCITGGASGRCQGLVELNQQHDNYANAARGFFAAAGVMGVAATASIWIVRTPAAPTLQIKPSVAGTFAGLTLQGPF